MIVRANIIPKNNQCPTYLVLYSHADSLSYFFIVGTVGISKVNFILANIAVFLVAQ